MPSAHTFTAPPLAPGADARARIVCVSVDAESLHTVADAWRPTASGQTRAVRAAIAAALDRPGSAALAWYGPFPSHLAPLSARDAATALLRDGWRDGVAHLDAMRARLGVTEIAPPSIIGRRQVWREEGDDIEVDRALRGDFDTAWRGTRRHRPARGRQRLTIVSPFGCNAHTAPEDYLWTGVAAVLLCDLLEGAGYAVELRGADVNVTAQHTGDTYIDVLYKRAGEPLVLATALAALAHVGIARTFGFLAVLATGGTMDSGLGKSRPDLLAEMSVHIARHSASMVPVPDIVAPVVTSQAQCAAMVEGLLAWLDGGAMPPMLTLTEGD